MKLWICVVGGEDSDKYDEERVVAHGGIKDIDNGIEQYADEVASSFDKYFCIESDHSEWTFEDADQYYDTIRSEIVRETSLQNMLGRILLPKNF